MKRKPTFHNVVKRGHFLLQPPLQSGDFIFLVHLRNGGRGLDVIYFAGQLLDLFLQLLVLLI